MVFRLNNNESLLNIHYLVSVATDTGLTTNV